MNKFPKHPLSCLHKLKKKATEWYLTKLTTFAQQHFEHMNVNSQFEHKDRQTSWNPRFAKHPSSKFLSSRLLRTKGLKIFYSLALSLFISPPPLFSFSNLQWVISWRYQMSWIFKRQNAVHSNILSNQIFHWQIMKKKGWQNEGGEKKAAKRKAKNEFKLFLFMCIRKMGTLSWKWEFLIANLIVNYSHSVFTITVLLVIYIWTVVSF